VRRAVFFGLGSDGTVGANKASVKIIGEQPGMHAQAYFVYDSKKSGSITVSHLRFGAAPIRASYLVREAQFVACHQFHLLDRIDVLDVAAPGATFLLNSPYDADSVWAQLPAEVQAQILARHIRLFVIDAASIARESGLGGRVNTVLATCFFALSDVIPVERAIAALKRRVRDVYGAKGDAVVAANDLVIDAALARLHEVHVPAAVNGARHRPPAVPDEAPAFVRDVLGLIIAGRGDTLPVSAMPPDGSFPTATSQWERRGIAAELPVWDPSICIDCAKCTLVCPHSALRMKVYDPAALDGAPAGFQSKPWRSKEQPGMVMTIAVSPDDCTGCGICADYCPAHSKTDASHRSVEMAPVASRRDEELRWWRFFGDLPEMERSEVRTATIKGSQMVQPLFEFPGACAGCGETPYLKLLTQMFGDRMIVANATGCSSIYGGNLPTTPWSVDRHGHGPAWANSLFEDNAEFGYGMRLALDHRGDRARELLQELSGTIDPELAAALLDAPQDDEAGIAAQRARVEELRSALDGVDGADARRLAELADALVRTSLWIVGGDGWAYDIGYGGLDHVLASGRDVNVLVLDTEVYSNTGGQASKATPRGAVAKFAAGGKRTGKKDLGMIASTYGNVYVAQVALGADNAQTIKAFAEADAHRGPSLVIAYSHCEAHGIDMATAMSHQKEAVDSGYWPLWRRLPDGDGAQHPLHLDSRHPVIPLRQFEDRETRFTALRRKDAGAAEELLRESEHDVAERRHVYEQLTSVEHDVENES
jgi:pyruvate-ferredoxin/flavodoxin oxidoreductase